MHANETPKTHLGDKPPNLTKYLEHHHIEFGSK
jgi:hypothetical protein